MARRRRSLLGGSKRPPSLTPAPERAVQPPSVEETSEDGGGDVPTLDDAPTVSPDEQALEDAETELISTEPRAKVPPADDQVSFDDLVEDDAPLIGEDLPVPPADEGDDHVQAPEEIASSLHAAPPTEEPPAELAAVTDDSLVAFDERPGEAAIGDVEVQEDPAPASIDAEDPPDMAAPGVPDVVPPGFDEQDVPKLRGGTPEPAPPRPASPAPGFEESGDPPTEDQPGHLPEDLASLYQAPMNVPEPPPIPGILDRYTPAPARHTEGVRPSSAGPSEDRTGFVPTKPASSGPPPSLEAPSGMWDETPIAKDTPPPVPVVRHDPIEAEPPIWQDPWFITIVSIAAVAALVVLLVALVFWNSNPGAQDSIVQPRTVTPVMPTNDRPPADPMQADDAGSPVDVVEPETVQPVSPEPAATAKPKRVRKPAPTSTEDPVARTGRLKIRSARQVLVSINGQPVGMTPLDLDKPAGRYVVTASVDGRQVEQRVDLTIGTIRLIEL